MAADVESFEWRPTGGKRRTVPLAWLTVVSAFVAAGVFFGQMQSIETLVSAFKHNGVPAKKASQASEQFSSQRFRWVNAPAHTIRRPHSGHRRIALPLALLMRLDPGFGRAQQPDHRHR